MALVTGAARGIGMASAAALHGRGASVVLTDREAAPAALAAAAIGTDRTLGLAADVTDRAALDAAVDEAVGRFGGLDVVVANAGVAPPAATVRGTRDGEFERVVAVNLTGVWHTVRAALPQVVERGGHVVLLGSVYSFANGMLVAPYAMAKAGVEQLGRALRRELAVHGAGVSVAYFGFVDTAMVRDGMSDPLAAEIAGHIPRPLRKVLTAEEAGAAIAAGIERRAPTITAPRRWALVRAVRGLSDPLEDRVVARHRRVTALLAEADDRGGRPAPG